MIKEAVLIFLILNFLGCGSNAEAKELIKIGFVSFLSGPAAGDYGVPAKRAAEAIAHSINQGLAPSPYNINGFSGTTIKLIFSDESGGVTKQVTEFNQLVLRQKVDFVVGYLSSANCLAISPIAERLEILTILMDCGTARIFEENKYEYVFRTRAHATMDVVAGAKYLIKYAPGLKSFSGINPNYAYGKESWRDWQATLAQLSPDLKVSASVMPNLGAGNYNSEISSLLAAESDLIFSSLWGGDLKAFLIQASARNLFENSRLMLVAGEPNLDNISDFLPHGTIVSSRGMTSGMMGNDSELNNWLKKIMDDMGQKVTYPVYSVANAILGLKRAYEKARLKKIRSAVPMADVSGVKEGMEEAYYQPPTTEEIAKSFKYLRYETPNGLVKMTLGDGHQATHGTSYGMTSKVNGKLEIVNKEFFPATEVQPPPGTKSEDWIQNGFK